MQNAVLKKIIQKRLENNFSQDYMASKLQISQSYYNKIENGKKELTLQRIIQIVKILNISIIDLFESGNHLSA